MGISYKLKNGDLIKIEFKSNNYYEKEVHFLLFDGKERVIFELDDTIILNDLIEKVEMNYKAFKENKKLHTYTFPPFKVEFIGDIKATEDNILAVVKSRNIQYSIKNTEYI